MAIEDQKLRTMEALERRFARAKAELEVQEQLKNKKRPIEDKEKVASTNYSSPAFPKAKRPFQDKEKVASTSYSSPGFPKAKRPFLDSSSRKDVELNEPAYMKLSHPVDGNLLQTGAEVSGRKVVDQVLHELLQHGDSAQKYMQGSKSVKIENTILLDNFVKKSFMLGSGHEQTVQKGSKRSKKHMSLRRHKSSGSFDLPKEFHDYEIFKPMHEKWKSYTQQLLKNVGKNQLAQCFLNADLHGAIILVVQCKIAGYVGVHGIMVRETKEAFGIISHDNKFRVVPKKPSVFVLQADCWKITLHGDKLESRGSLIP